MELKMQRVNDQLLIRGSCFQSALFFTSPFAAAFFLPLLAVLLRHVCPFGFELVFPAVAAVAAASAMPAFAPVSAKENFRQHQDS